MLRVDRIPRLILPSESLMFWVFLTKKFLVETFVLNARNITNTQEPCRIPTLSLPNHSPLWDQVAHFALDNDRL